MPVLTFPDGKQVNVEFDPTAHSYVVAHKLEDGDFSDFRPTHGATAPLAVVDKPFLAPWGSKEGVLATIDYFTNHPEIVERLPQFWTDYEAFDNDLRLENGKPVFSRYKMDKTYPWFKDAKSAYKRKANVGKELGTWLHENIQAFYESGRKHKPTIPPDDAEMNGMWYSFIEFDNFFKPDVEVCEFIVYSMMFGYSGQGDVKATINGKYCIGDWKSTNRSDQNEDGITIEYFYQVGGLAQAEFERTGKWVEDLFIANFDKKGEQPRVIFASEFGMSPQDAARAYISCFNNYHTQQAWDYKFKKRG